MVTASPHHQLCYLSHLNNEIAKPKRRVIAFARAGAKVVVASRSVENGKTVNLIEKTGGNAVFVQTDVIQEAQGVTR